MSKNSARIDTKLENMVELISEDRVAEQVGEAVASLLRNPTVSWAKFILTDDSPNGNRMRIPADEFDNLIESGIHMPVKMAEGYISKGHPDTRPLGVITHLKKESDADGNRIVALAALWFSERPDDVEHIRKLMDDGEEVNVSWEVSYGNASASEEGIMDLHNVILKAATIVARPAYKGRTRFLAVAGQAREWSPAYIAELPDTSFLHIEDGGEKDSEGKTSPRELRHFPIKDNTGLIEFSRLKTSLDEAAESKLPEEVLSGVRARVKSLLGRIDAGASLEEISTEEGYTPTENINTEEDKLNELELLKEKVANLTTELEDTKNQLKAKEDALKNVEASLETLAEEKSTLETELTPLREFKSEVEAEAEKVQKMNSVKAKFAEAKLEKDEKFFEDNQEKFLKMDDEQLDFMIQEFAAFANNAEASQEGMRIPPFTNGAEGNSIKDIVAALRARKAK